MSVVESPSAVNDLERVLRVGADLPEGWHPSGTCSLHLLLAFARHLLTGPIRSSAETGCGLTTALVSQVSAAHTVFTLAHPATETPAAYERDIFREHALHFVLGPAQRTLRRHRFAQPLDLAVIDGPRAFPAPDLAYYAFYPHLAPGALLVVNGIAVPTIRNLFNFLNEDGMFRLVEVSDGAAFYRRTAERALDACCDGWTEQGYNRRTAPAELQPFV